VTIPFVLSVALFLGLLLFLIHELRRPPGPREWGRTPKWKKRVRVVLATVPVLLAGVALWGFFIEPHRLIIRQQAISNQNLPKELSGLRIAVISDIHVGGPFIDEAKLKQIVSKTNALNPDLVLLLGDYMSGNSWHGHRVEPEIFAPWLKGFNAPLGVYSVLGNHDWWYNGRKVRQALEANGMKVLDDEVAEVKWRGGSFWLAGLADFWTRPQNIMQTIAKVPPGQAVIAMTHNPDIFPEVPEQVPLLLAGHTHGGQVNLPLIGRPIEPSIYGQHYAAGLVFEHNHYLFVTTGIGISILPVRFRVPPEIVLLTINQ